MARISYSNRIRQRIAQLEAEIASRQSELSELRIAEKVINQMIPEDDVESGESAPKARPKTVAELILECLERDGPGDTQTVFARTNEIQGTTINTIASYLSRMKADGKVQLDGRIWSTAQREGEPEGSPATDDGKGGNLSGIFS